MKATIFLVFLLCLLIDAYDKFPKCPHYDLTTEFQDNCDVHGDECTSKWGEIGVCDKGKCCPGASLDHIFKTNQRCMASSIFPKFRMFCKDGFYHTIGQKHLTIDSETLKICDRNKDCPDGSYCVGYYDGRCYVIDEPEKKEKKGKKEKKEDEEEKKTSHVEEKDNTLMIVIIIVSIVVLIGVGIGIKFLIWPKMKQAKIGQNQSVENGQNKKMEKASKQKNMKKGNKGSNV
ncbi:unnamed protein product [Caenorhabditis angaria]|uniref:Domain of unknown function DX domain-containing protein n=1 Tax=Caenorhabditis angaria TaxID=860376 RepID=A0A9P1IJS6_9PELO|nr:unnamed protein product [Caenorhabditis angaria]